MNHGRCIIELHVLKFSLLLASSATRMLPVSLMNSIASQFALARISKKMESELNTLSREIWWYEEEARKTAKLALQYKLEIGKRLARAKDMMEPAQFVRWARHEFGWTRRHIRNHLALAANAGLISQLAPAASLRMALAAIKESKYGTPKHFGAESAACSVQRVHLVGEITSGILDCDNLMREIINISNRLGVPNITWRLRKPKTGVTPSHAIDISDCREQ